MVREYIPISISAEYADGLVLPWSTHHHLILSRDKSGSSPPILRICAPALDVQISQDGNWVGRDEGNIFKYIQNRLHRFGEALVRDARIAYQPKQHEDGELQFTYFFSLGESVVYIFYCSISRKAFPTSSV
jgi:hypothetical protein